RTPFVCTSTRAREKRRRFQPHAHARILQMSIPRRRWHSESVFPRVHSNVQRDWCFVIYRPLPKSVDVLEEDPKWRLDRGNACLSHAYCSAIYIWIVLK